MAITFGAAGNVATGSTSLDVPRPSGVTAGSLLVLAIWNKYPANTPTAPSGWTLVPDSRSTGGAGANGSDAGTFYTQWFYRVATGSETGSLTVSIPSGNTSAGRMFRYECASDNWDLVACPTTNTQDYGPGVTQLQHVSTALDIATGDVLGACFGFNTDTLSGTGQAFTASGITFGAIQGPYDSAIGSGDFGYLDVSFRPVTAGSGNVAPTYTVTPSATIFSLRSGASLLRIREVTSGGPVPITGSLASTLGAATLTATGTASSTPITGALTGTLGAATVTSSGSVRVSGSSLSALGAATSSATGAVRTIGASAQTLGAATASGTGAVRVTGSASSTLGTATAAAAGVVRTAGAVTRTLGDALALAAGTVLVVGSLTRPLGGVTLTATGGSGQLVTGSLTSTLGTASGTATGAVQVRGSASSTLGAASGTATGAAQVRGTSSSTLGAATASATATVAIRGTASSTLDAASLTSTAIAPIRGSVAATLDAATLVASDVARRVWWPVEDPAHVEASFERPAVFLFSTLTNMGHIAKHDLEVFQNDDVASPIYFFDRDKSPLDLSGLSARMQLRAGPQWTDTLILTLTSEPGGGIEFSSDSYPGTPGPAPTAPNGFVISVTAAQSIDIPHGSYPYDVVLTGVDGQRHVVLRGQVKVVSTVTRDPIAPVTPGGA